MNVLLASKTTISAHGYFEREIKPGYLQQKGAYIVQVSLYMLESG